MVPAIWNYLVGYAAGTAIAVIGLYIAFIIPVFLRFRMGDRFEPGAWTLGRHYKWIDAIAISWVALITILFIFPLYKAGLPWEDDFSWEADELRAVLWFGGDRARCSAAGGCSRPRTGSRVRWHKAQRRSSSGSRRSSSVPQALPRRVPDASTGAGLQGPRPSLPQHERARHVVVQRLPALRPERHQVADRERRERREVHREVPHRRAVEADRLTCQIGDP